MPEGPSNRVAQWAEKIAFNATDTTFNVTDTTFNATDATFNVTSYGLWVWTKAIINHKQQPPKRPMRVTG